MQFPEKVLAFTISTPYLGICKLKEYDFVKQQFLVVALLLLSQVVGGFSRRVVFA